MTDLETTPSGSDDPGQPGATGRTARPHPPGSRLRRALDLARKSAAPPPDAVATAPMASGDVPAPPVRTAPVPEPLNWAEPAPAATVTALIPAAAATTGRHRGAGRGLDALLPPEGSPTEPAPETWETAAQGWVRNDEGGLEWRPIVTTVDRLDAWEVTTYLGIVSGQAHTGTTSPDSVRMTWGRREAVGRMVEEAVRRGAHGVIGVVFSLTAAPTGLTVTAVGTAVTLGHRS